MKKIYLIIALVFTVGLGLFDGANAEERNCKPDLTCFLDGDFMEYSAYMDGKLDWKNTYEYAGLFDENRIMVQITDESFIENFSMIVDGKRVSSTTSGKDIDLRSGISAQVLYGYSYYVIQPSPVNTDRWLKDSPSAESWKGKVTEGNFIYKDKTRTVIIVKSADFIQTIDKQTGILLLLEYTGPKYDSYFKELTSTNIIDGNSITEKKIPIIQSEPIIKQRIPDWVKNIFVWYEERKISELDMINAMEYLKNRGIINVDYLEKESTPQDCSGNFLKKDCILFNLGKAPIKILSSTVIFFINPKL